MIDDSKRMFGIFGLKPENKLHPGARHATTTDAIRAIFKCSFPRALANGRPNSAFLDRYRPDEVGRARNPTVRLKTRSAVVAVPVGAICTITTHTRTHHDALEFPDGKIVLLTRSFTAERLL